MSNEGNFELSDEHIEIYDRQIRVWGPEAQKLLSNTRIFLSPLNSLNFEIGKNCILSGMNLQISDSGEITQEDISNNLFFPQSSLGCARSSLGQSILSNINTLSQISISDSLSTASILCFSGSLEDALEISKKAVSQGVGSYYIFSSKLWILVISDIHLVSLESLLSSIPAFLSKPKSRPNPRFYSFLGFLYSKFSNSEVSSISCIIPPEVFLKQITEISSCLNELYYPAIQITAGLVSQDMIRYLTKREDLFSTLLFDCESCTAYADKII